GHSIHTLLIDPDGVLTYTGTHQYFISQEGTVSLTREKASIGMGPVNIAIAPDNQTVLVSGVSMYADIGSPPYSNLYAVGVYKITEPGQIEFVEAITGLPHAMQTITFNKTGRKAVLLGN